MVEHGTENAGVDSSSLSLGTTTTKPLDTVANLPLKGPTNTRFADNLLTSFPTIHPA